MAIHFVCPLQELLKGFGAQRDDRGQPNASPNGEASANPVPHGELIFKRQAHHFSRVRISRNHHHMATAVCTNYAVVKKPLINRRSIHLRFSRTETF